MFRLKPRPGERQEPWMLKKVDDEFAKPEEGEALVEHCVTSVTTDRSMAEIAREPMSGIPTARQPGKPAAPSARPGRSACFPATAAGDPGRCRAGRQRLAARV